MRKQLIFTFSATLSFLSLTAQNNVNIQQEFGLTAGLTLYGTNTMTVNDYNEQGLGFNVSVNYSALFNNIGPTLEYYYRIATPNESTIIEHHNSTQVNSELYRAEGVMAGIKANLPLSEGEMPSSIVLSLKAGGFIAYMPEQEFTLEDQSKITVLKSSAAGFTRAVTLGYKIRVDDAIALSADINSCWERATLLTTTTDDLTEISAINWKYAYPEIRIGAIYLF